jgi:hypothetical protein
LKACSRRDSVRSYLRYQLCTIHRTQADAVTTNKEGASPAHRRVKCATTNKAGKMPMPPSLSHIAMPLRTWVCSRRVSARSYLRYQLCTILRTRADAATTNEEGASPAHRRAKCATTNKAGKMPTLPSLSHIAVPLRTWVCSRRVSARSYLRYQLCTILRTRADAATTNKEGASLANRREKCATTNKAGKMPTLSSLSHIAMPPQTWVCSRRVSVRSYLRYQLCTIHRTRADAATTNKEGASPAHKRAKCANTNKAGKMPTLPSLSHIAVPLRTWVFSRRVSVRSYLCSTWADATTTN